MRAAVSAAISLKFIFPPCLEIDERLDLVVRGPGNGRGETGARQRVVVEKDCRGHAWSEIGNPVRDACDVALLLLRAHVLVGLEIIVAKKCLPPFAELRSGPYRPTLGVD